MASAHTKARLLFASLLCAGGLAAGLWYFQSSRQYTTYRIDTHDAVSGLIPDSPVELHGVEVGKVTSIELTDARSVRILLSVVKTAPVSKATVATITARGLAARGFTGYVYVALENTGSDSDPLTAQPGQLYPSIPAAPPQTDTMDTAVTDATQKLQHLTALLNSLLDENTTALLKRSIAGLQDIIATVTANNERLSSLIANAERDSRIIGRLLEEKTITSLKGSLESFQEIMATLRANNERLGALIVNAERDSREIRPLLETSSTTMRELRTQLLPQMYRSIGDLDGLVRSLDGLSKRLARDPAMVIRGVATPPGPGER
ncbi:MAG: MCE family protein [Acetobacteraceae bacterium]|nr:MCE family protein [Acetobacteraceae bacterium]